MAPHPPIATPTYHSVRALVGVVVHQWFILPLQVLRLLVFLCSINVPKVEVGFVSMQPDSKPTKLGDGDVCFSTKCIKDKTGVCKGIDRKNDCQLGSFFVQLL